MQGINKHSLIIVLIAVGLLISFMMLLPPTAGTVVVLIWFGLVGAVLYAGLQLLSDVFSTQWSRVRVILYAVAVLSLIGLSTLDQLTVLDVATVVILTALAQLAYQLRVKSK